MPMYHVTLTETTTHEYNITADDEEQAFEAATDLWQNDSEDGQTTHHGVSPVPSDARIEELQAEEEE